MFRCFPHRLTGTVAVTYVVLTYALATNQGVYSISIRSPPHLGREGVSNVSRIVGGERASDIEVKYSAHLYISFGDSIKVLCGATAIARRHVLTAAHCLIKNNGRSASGVSVYVGTVDRYSTTPFFATRLFIHRSYFYQSRAGTDVYVNDIAVVQLDRQIPLEQFFPVSLATSESDFAFAGDVLASGFGQYIDGGSLSLYLRSVQLKIQPSELCLNYERKNLRALINYPRQLCGTSPGFPDIGGKDTCNGDSGGPLYWFRNRRMIQVGITSWASTPCASSAGVAWYTNLTTYASDVNALLSDNQQAWTTYP